MTGKNNSSDGTEHGSGWREPVAQLLAGPVGGVLTALLLLLGLAATFLHHGWLVRNTGQVVALLALILLWRRWLRPRYAAFAGRPVTFRGTKRDFAWGDVVLEVMPPLLVLGMVCAIFYRIFAGDVPLYNDHTNHFYQGWVMADRLLPTGRISGWVPTRGAGYPAGVLYPVGANLLIAGVRYITFGALSWDHVYGIAFLLAMLGCHLSAYLAGRLLVSRTAGLVAGLLSAIDAGAYRQAGWNFAVNWGVWPVVLSAAMGLLAVVFLHRAMARPGAKGVAPFALLAGASLVTHPMSLAFLGLAVPATMVHAMIEVGDRHPLRVGGKGLWAALLGVGLSAFWLVPFLAFRGEARTLGTGSLPLAQQAAGIINLGFFKSWWVVAAALALLGAVAAWRNRWPGARLITLLLVGIAIALSGDTLLGLELDRSWSRLANLQPDRFYIYLRIMAYILAGIGVSWVVSILRTSGRTAFEHLTRRRRTLLLVTACIVFGTAVVPLFESFGWTQLGPRFGWRGRPDFWGDYVATAEFIRDHAEEHGGFVRSTWPRRCPNGDIHCFQSSPIYTGLGNLHNYDYYTVCSYDRLFGLEADNATNRLLGVRYRVARSPRSNERELFRSGPFHVFEVPDVATEPFTVVGAATARLLELEDELLRVEVSSVEAGDHLMFHIPHFPNWHAYLDGEELTMELRDQASVRGLMTVPLPRNGTVELRYQRGAPEILGALATLLALALCLITRFQPQWLLSPDRRLGKLLRVLDGWASERRLDGAVKIGAAVLVLLSVVGVALYAHRVSSLRRDFDTVTDLHRARVWTVKRGAVHECRRTWRGAFRCGAKAHERVEARYVWTTMGHPHGAIYAHPKAYAPLHVEYDNVSLGKSLRVAMGIVHGGGGKAPVKLAIAADGKAIFHGSFAKERGWEEQAFSTADLASTPVKLRFTVTSKRPNRRQFVFRAWTSDEEAPPFAAVKTKTRRQPPKRGKAGGHRKSKSRAKAVKARAPDAAPRPRETAGP